MPLVHANIQMSEVVEAHTSLIPVINRLGIRLGLKDKSIRQVCEEHHLDTDFVLIIINTFLHEEYFPEKRLKAFHLSQIIDYLHKTNQYYLRNQLPNIARHLEAFIAKSNSGNTTLVLIGKFFRSFKEQLTAQIEKEEQEWFPYCLELAASLPAYSDGEAVPPAEEEEESTEALLVDLKSIMIKHLSGEYNENLCYAVIFAISSLEKDMKQHNRIRCRILQPMVRRMEQLKQMNK